jgi:hypothetical protein
MTWNRKKKTGKSGDLGSRLSPQPFGVALRDAKTKPKNFLILFTYTQD